MDSTRQADRSRFQQSDCSNGFRSFPGITSLAEVYLLFGLNGFPSFQPAKDTAPLQTGNLNPLTKCSVSV